MESATARRSRPGLLLSVLLALTPLVEGGVYSYLYPRFALFSWVLPFVLGVATAGAALYVLPAGRGSIPQWSAAATAILIAQATALLSVIARALLLLERYDEGRSWALLLRPAEWWSLQKAVVGLDICCTRGGDVFSPLAHWSFLTLELAATLGGAVFVVVTLHGQRRPDGSLPD
jgi:hypothetical protein